MARHSLYSGSIPACAGEPAERISPPAPSAVYPRVCGGTSPLCRCPVGWWGLSPRVRGNHLVVKVSVLADGSIPACAGEPPGGCVVPVPPGVYPRVCGGTWGMSAISPRNDGLSPRVRGNLGDKFGQRNQGGSIPACAGEPVMVPGLARLRKVYPRVCGGTRPRSSRNRNAGGLSPRVRGNRQRHRRRLRNGGSIPACAGEPGGQECLVLCRRVYPRVCGGTIRDESIASDMGGLSPRVRGNLDTGLLRSRWQGSIPACAGEPRTSPVDTGLLRVYPRVCGGTTTEVRVLEFGGGLSPRVRGNLGYPLGFGSLQGSIPACAGEPGLAGSPRAGRRVYPRVCGGTIAGWHTAVGRGGLSPRVRGNLLPHNPAAEFIGSIPACAGEPPQRVGAYILQRVYPRVCGGTLHDRPNVTAGTGLSPRVRGNPFSLGRSLLISGSIPACAGEPRSPCITTA